MAFSTYIIHHFIIKTGDKDNPGASGNTLTAQQRIESIKLHFSYSTIGSFGYADYDVDTLR